MILALNVVASCAQFLVHSRMLPTTLRDVLRVAQLVGI